MKLKIKLFGLILACLVLSGSYSCGGNGNPSGIASITITNCPTNLFPGDTQQLSVVARDSSGNVIGGVVFSFNSSNGRFDAIDASGNVQALYTGMVTLTAQASGVVSNNCDVTVDPPTNNGQIQNISNNGGVIEDNWGLNNFWPMISFPYVFWQQDDGVDIALLLHDVRDPVGMNGTVKDNIVVDVDFMALGSGANTDEVMGAWREDLNNSFVSDVMGNNQNLGPQEQEENTIDTGCYFFRKNTVQDILRFTFLDGLSTVGSTGVLSNPISSNCQAIWLEDVGGGMFDLNYFDGNNTTPVATGPFSQGQYDFSNGRIVYSLNNDVFLYDTTQANPQDVNITNRPQDLNNFVKTDGDSILFTRAVNGGADNDVVLYDISSGIPSIISTTDVFKEGNSLQIDLKQALWLEGSNLFFHDGSGDMAGTMMVPVPNPLNLGFDPFISYGVVTWIGNDGDDDVYVMQ